MRAQVLRVGDLKYRVLLDDAEEQENAKSGKDVEASGLMAQSRL